MPLYEMQISMCHYANISFFKTDLVMYNNFILKILVLNILYKCLSTTVLYAKS